MQRITGEKRKSISNQVPPSKLKSIFDQLSIALRDCRRFWFNLNTGSLDYFFSVFF